MTQIVYDGRYIIADRKCTRGSTALSSTKLRHKDFNDVKRYWAFSGTFLECSLGDEVVESGFNQDVIEKVRRALPLESFDSYFGLLVEVSADGRSVYLINYAGDKCEVPNNKFIAVGAMYQELTLAYAVWQHCAGVRNVPAEVMFSTSIGVVDFDEPDPLLAVTNFIKFVVKDTMFNQDKYDFDCYDLNMGGKYRCV